MVHIVAQMARASITKTAQLNSVSIGTVTKMISAFISMGKTLINRVWKPWSLLYI